MKIVLFALTGMGNTVLKKLVDINQIPVLIVTRLETGEFPYYKENQITEACASYGIPFLYDEEGEIATQIIKPEIIISCTYHRLIPIEVIKSAKYSVNIHPSLLPKYKGKNPFYWVIKDREKFTGVSIHSLTNKYDQGELYLQLKIPILITDTQGTIRKKLSILAGKAITQFLFMINSLKQLNPINNDPKLIEEKFPINHKFEIIHSDIRALLPWPGINRES